MALIDYKNIEHDLVINVDGDFEKADMSQEHIENILLITKGSLRMKPLVGVNLIDYVNAPWSLKTQVKLDKSIRVQLTLDGYSVKRIITKDLSNIIIDAIK